MFMLPASATSRKSFTLDTFTWWPPRIAQKGKSEISELYLGAEQASHYIRLHSAKASLLRQLSRSCANDLAACRSSPAPKASSSRMSAMIKSSKAKDYKNSREIHDGRLTVTIRAIVETEGGFS